MTFLFIKLIKYISCFEWNILDQYAYGIFIINIYNLGFVIRKNNNNVQQIVHNQKLIPSINNILKDFKLAYKKNLVIIKNLMNKGISLFEIIASILQDKKNLYILPKLLSIPYLTFFKN